MAARVNSGIRLDRILTDFGKLLTGPAKDAVLAAQSDPKLTVAQKVAALFGVLGAGRYVLLLDNLESFAIAVRPMTPRSKPVAWQANRSMTRAL